MESLIFLWVQVHVRICVHPPTMKSLLPPVLWGSWNQTPLAFKATCSGGSYSQCWTHRLGCLTWGSELSQLWENFCNIIILQFVAHPPEWYGIWLYHLCAPPTISLWFLLYVFGCSISFLVGSSLFLINGYAAVSCDFGVLMRGGELKVFLLCHLVSLIECLFHFRQGHLWRLNEIINDSLNSNRETDTQSHAVALSEVTSQWGLNIF